MRDCGDFTYLHSQEGPARRTHSKPEAGIMTAQVLNGTLAQSAYVEDLVHLTQDLVESTTGGLSNSDTWTYQFCNRTTFSPLFYGRIIAEQTVPEQRLGYEDATLFNCSTTTV